MKNDKGTLMLMRRKSVSGWGRFVTTAALICLSCVLGTAAQAQSANAAPATVFVHTAFGGFILGYDIDQRGSIGLLSEALTLSDGKHDVAVETFDPRTGKILKIITRQTETQNDFVTFGIFGNNVGLVEYEEVKHIFVDKRLYVTMDPVKANKVTGTWTPALTKDELIIGVAASQGADNTAVLFSQNFNSAVFSTNVAANTFGPVLPIADSVFAFNDSPTLAYNPLTNQAVLAASNGGILSLPQIASVELSSGATEQFTGTGFGYVNGLALDPQSGIACTTSEVDFSVEFYDVAAQTGFKVRLPNATSQAQSGGAVAFDPIHKLFLVGQEFSSTAPTGSSIQVFDEKGNFVESVNGLSLPASPAYMALIPARRTGYVIVTPDLTSLQEFTY